ncbi:PHP domain-containing protein [uncultured Clostridium sp.]|uniref:PHP domain-containing protein n=1 Tax=uncultured Clostridium sp. TaxID=59620 RepID=UPI002598D25E|nr:PHP domain-containing protein [uncultured Clostridium sp.]
MKRYNNYHKHDYYGNIKSLDVVVSPLEYIQRAKELDGDKAIFFSTNHGYQGNIYEYYTLCKEHGVKLIAGVEVYYVPDRFEKDRRNYHLIIIAKNKNGYKQINSIMSEANTTGFYYKPRVDDELIFKLNPNDVVITTACIASRLRDIEGAEDWIIKMKEYFKDNFYLEVQNHNVESQKEYNKRLLEYSKKYNIPIIHANDSHYIYEKDSKYRNLFLKAKGITYGEEDSFILDYPNYETILKRYENQGILTREQAKIALDNTLIFDSLEGIEFDYEIKMPYISDNPSKELGGIIKKEFEKEIKKNHISIKRKEEYIQAIKEEWKVIEETKMHEYFLINYKMVHLAVNKYNGIITKSSRGSAPSFYINKLLGFTSLDRLNSPITLYPSRFMSATRILQSKSLPDIDTNVAFQQPFIDASKELLGEDNCQWMVSFKPLQDASAFRLYCKAIDMEVEEYDEIAKNLDEYREDKEWKDIIEESKHFVGVVEAISQSPCSTLLLSEPISQQIGLLKIGDIICCNIDGINCDRYKFLKNDILAVSVYKIIYKVCELIGIDIPSTQELTNLLDEKTWKIYEDGLTCTINQADSNFATPLVMKYKPKSVAEMSAFVAAIRPGFASLLEGFINRKPYTTGVKELDDLLEDSYHYLMYQESIMKYLIWLGIPESETYTIIKKISKKKFKEKELKELKTKLRQGWNKVVGKEEGFEETWQVINDSASYSFNASHSLSYAYDSLYGAYLKSHYPLEYYTVALNQYKDDLSRTPRLINECKYFNIKIQTPKFGYSKAEYSFDKETRTIYKGVGSLKYLNEQKADFLYELSQSKEYKTFTELLCDIKPIGNRCILILIKLGYFSKFGSISKLLKVFELYKDKGNKKTMSKTKDIELYMTYKELAEKNATKETAKTLTINYISFIKDIELTLEDTEDDIVQLIKDEIEYTGGFNAVPYKQMDKNACFISDLKVYNYNVIITLFCFYSGNVKTFKMDKKIYNQCPFTKEEVLYLYGFVPRKNKKSKTVDYYITDFEVA